MIYKLALIFRSLALFAVLYQVRLITDDLADTSIFIATLLIAFLSAVFLGCFQIGKKQPQEVGQTEAGLTASRRWTALSLLTAEPPGANYPGAKPPRSADIIRVLVTICLVPWVVRALVALPRIFFPAGAGISPLMITLDSMLLNLDRNNFVSLIPFYWTAISTYFCFNYRRFLRAAVIIDASILLVLYCIARASNIELYRWPIIIIIVFSGIVFFQILALLFSRSPRLEPRAI